MASIDQVVDISITRATLTVSRAGFGIPLLMGEATGILDSGEVGQYSSLAAVASAGFLTSSTVYKMASAIFSQNPRPQYVLVAPTSTPVAQVITYTPDVSVQEVQTYTVTIDGVEYSFESDSDPTDAEVVTGLTSEINGDADCLATASGTTTLILTADTAGLAFSYSASENLGAAVVTNANNGIGDDIAAALQTNPNFYGVLIESRTKATILQAAAQVESIKRLLGVCSGDADVKNGVASNVLEELEALGYDRTFLLFSDTQANFPEVAWVGDTFALDPGKVNFAYRNLNGQVADVLTDTQQNNIQSLNGNTYEEIGGVDVTFPGKVVSGEWIDVIRDIDWLEARMKEDVLSALVNNDKIPFTDQGGTMIGNIIQKRLENAVTEGVLSSYTLTVPKVADIPSEDRAARFFTGITFTGILAGAINKVEIRGVVSV